MFLSFLFSWFVIEVLTSQNFGSYVTGVAFHPEDRVVASCSEDRSIKLWNLDDGGLLSTMRGHSEPINSVAFSPDGQFIASCSGVGSMRDNSVRVWNAETGEQLWQLRGHSR